MKTLTLIIKQIYFDQILAGTKTQEFREIKQSTEKKYLIYIDEDGNRYTRNDDIPFEKNIHFEIIPYDAIQLYVGYNKDRDSALIEVKNIEVDVLDTNWGFMIIRQSGILHYRAQMVYTLGNVLSKSVKSR